MEGGMAFSLRRSMAWMTFSQGCGAVLQFATTVVVARLLTPYETGVFAVATAIAGAIALLRTFGLSNYVIRAPAVDRDFLAGVFTVNIVVSALVAVLIALISLVGGKLLGEPGVRHVLLALAVVPLLACLEFVPSSCIERAGNFRVVALVNLVRNAIGSAVILAAAYAGHSYMSLAYGQIASALVAVAVMNVVGWRHASLRLGLKGWRDIARYGIDILTTFGVSTITQRMLDVVLGWMLGLHALGLYSRAAGLMAMIWENFQVIMLRVAFVELVSQRNAGHSFRGSYLRILSVSTALLWPAFGGLAVVSGPVLRTVYGPQWVEAAPVLSLLAIVGIVTTTILLTWEVFMASDETRRLAKLQVVQSSFSLVAFTLGCLGGIVGAAAARVVETLFNMRIYRPHLARMTETNAADVLPIFGRAAVLMALAIAPAMAVMLLHGWSPAAPLLHVLPAIAAGMLCWLVGLWRMDHPLYREIRRAAARLFPRLAPPPTP
jgi:O-antigen/teichoic acid export membrane protein